MKRPWIDFCKEYVEKTGNCPGMAPGFGLPTDKVTAEEFMQSVSLLSKHPVSSCSCWEGTELNMQVSSRNRVPHAPPSTEVVLEQVEVTTRKNLVAFRNHLELLIGRVRVQGFRIEGSRIVWDLSCPDLLKDLALEFGLVPAEPPKPAGKDEKLPGPKGMERIA